MAQGFSLVDNGFYYAIESAFGTQATTLKGALGITQAAVTPGRPVIEGEAFLGSGTFFAGQDIPTGVTVGWTVTGWGSITQVMAFVATACNGVKGSTTAAGTTGFSHPYSNSGKNQTKKYMTLAFVENETSSGAGLKRIMVRDAIANSVKITAQSGQVFGFTASGNAISMGPGATSTFSFNNTLHVPDLANPANVITYPSFFPAGFCSSQFNMSYDATLAYGPYCIGSPTASDIIISKPRWTIDGAGIADTNFSSFHDTVWYDSASPGTTANELKAKLQSGALDIVVVSDDIIASSSPPTPFSAEFSFPNMQFIDAHFEGDNPRMGMWQAKSVGGANTLTLINDLSSSAQAL